MEDQVCTDCGCRPQWWFSNLKYCKQCHDKSHRTFIEVDVDFFLRITHGNVHKARRLVDLVHVDSNQVPSLNN